MENNNNQTNETKNSKFKTVFNSGRFKTVYEIDNKPKKKFHFGKNIFLPFFIILIIRRMKFVFHICLTAYRSHRIVPKRPVFSNSSAA